MKAKQNVQCTFAAPLFHFLHNLVAFPLHSTSFTLFYSTFWGAFHYLKVPSTCYLVPRGLAFSDQSGGGSIMGTVL